MLLLQKDTPHTVSPHFCASLSRHQMLLPLIVSTCAFLKRTHPGILEHFADMCRAAMPGRFFDPPPAQDGPQPMPLRVEM